jgi:hypothetical protein
MGSDETQGFPLSPLARIQEARPSCKGSVQGKGNGKSKGWHLQVEGMIKLFTWINQMIS